MGALPAARIEPRPLPAEAVENAIRAARKTGPGRESRPAVAVSASPNGTGPATPGGIGVRNRQTEVQKE